MGMPLWETEASTAVPTARPSEGRSLRQYADAQDRKVDFLIDGLVQT
jgi:hypothetical protein